jgi:hypothetical protein
MCGSSDRELSQVLLKGRFSSAVSGRYGFKKNGRRLYWVIPTGSINLPSPWLWGGRPFLNND